MRLHLACVVLLSAPSVFAWPFSFGIKGGVPLVANVETSQGYSSKLNRYVVGPSFEVELPHHFSVEVDALYRRMHYSGSYSSSSPSSFISTATSVKTKGNRWEVPFLVKHRFATGSALPYLGLGVSLDHIGWTQDTTTVVNDLYSRTSMISTSHGKSLPNSVGAGGVVAAGVEFRMRALRIAPEFRYVRLGSQNPMSFGPSTNPNQVDFLLGLSF